MAWSVVAAALIGVLALASAGGGSPIQSAAHAVPAAMAGQPATGSAPPRAAVVVADPCSGEDCIPQPTTTNNPPPPAGGVPGGSDDGGSGSDCGLTDISGCVSAAITSTFQALVNAALEPVLNLLGQTVLSTPTLDQLPGIGPLWNSSWQIVLACYSLLIIVGGILVMSHETVQSRYTLREILPRVIVGFLASALSLFFSDKMIRLANALTMAVLGQGIAPTALGDNLRQVMTGALSGSLFVILIGLLLVGLAFALLVVYVVRVVITLVLIVAGPLALMCHCLPHTDPLARWWWRAMAMLTGIQVAQSLVLIVALRVLLTSGAQLFSASLNSTGLLLVAIAIFYLLFRIPFWALSAAKVGSGGSLLGGLARAFVMAKTFGAIRTPGGAGGRTGGRARRVASTARTAADPPWPPPPRLAMTPAMLGRRLRQQQDAERLRASRRRRVPSLAPPFRQPTPRQPRPATPAGAPPFTSTTPPQAASGPQRTPPAAPVFREPGARPVTRVKRPPQTPPVPAALRFQPASTSSPTPPRPVPRPTPSAAARASAPPRVEFRAPAPSPASPRPSVRRTARSRPEGSPS